MIDSDFFDLIQKTCLPGVWSKGVALARADSAIQDSSTPDEIIFRVHGKDHPVSRKVTLWPEDEDWFCDCNDRNEVCAHVAAVTIALRSGKANTPTPESPKSNVAQVQYRF